MSRPWIDRPAEIARVDVERWLEGDELEAARDEAERLTGHRPERVRFRELTQDDGHRGVEWGFR